MTIAPKLARAPFTTNRLLEFCSQKELVLQTGHPVEQWPLVVLKELVDNALDACEEIGFAPTIQVIVKSTPNASITYLQEQRAGRAEPIALVVHLASPRIAYTDRGKSAVALRGDIDPDVDSHYDAELDQ